jgi:hypothetical protein
MSNKGLGGNRFHSRTGELRFHSKRPTIDSTISQNKLETASYKKSTQTINVPGPGTYEHSSKFPGGPKFHIQKKAKQDSLFLTKIAQNISPGPAKYSQRTGIGKPSQTFATSTLDPSAASLVTALVGPGTYDTMSSKDKNTLKQQPRVTIGNSKRLFLGEAAANPPPDKYSVHHKMTERKSNSRERNASRATIGRERRE